MRGSPLAIPLAWTCHSTFLPHGTVFACEIGGDCLRYRRSFR
jgi:hypothetical protein